LQKSISVFILSSALGAVIACSSNRHGVNEASARAVTVFADEISLEGYAIHAKDGHTAVELTWAAVKKPSADYYVFVHAIDSSDGIVFQLDHPLKNGAGQPTSVWATTDTVTDPFATVPPPNRTPGTYTLRMGVYLPSPMKLLQITRSGFPQPKDGWNDHAIVIENVDCR
jgi:hypothetical protein